MIWLSETPSIRLVFFAERVSNIWQYRVTGRPVICISDEISENMGHLGQNDGNNNLYI